jgi:hypothetical protein
VPESGDGRTLESIIDGQRAFLTSGATMNLLPSMPSVAVELVFAGELRPCDPETRGFLWQFGESFGQEDMRERFVQELHMLEGLQDYWMPVNPSVDTDGLEPGQSVTVVVQLLGSLDTEHGYRMIFAVLEIEDRGT